MFVSPPTQGFPGDASGKEPACQYRLDRRDADSTLGQEDPLEEGMATRSSILGWRIPWAAEPGGYSPGDRQSCTQLSDGAHACIYNSWDKNK